VDGAVEALGERWKPAAMLPSWSIATAPTVPPESRLNACAEERGGFS
jgi:hypothetical protein